ncbi:MAG: alpha-E domain-containing protein [Saprospiraceae bacterium]|nr:alpha-E domain-containing protein [Saprospiraceae bacterium]
MLSRVADAIFWIARYVERTKVESTFLHTNYVAIQDNAIHNNWLLVMEKYGNQSHISKMNKNQYQSPETLLHLITDKNNPASIVNNIMYARENARSVQDHITKEMWQMLNNFHHLIRNEKNEVSILNEDPIEVMDMVQQQCYLFAGTLDYTMDRGSGYYFLNIGKRMERVFQSIYILKIKLKEIDFNITDDANILSFRYVLYALSGNELFGKTYSGDMTIKNMLQFVLFNPVYTNSILYSLGRIRSNFVPLKEESTYATYSQIEYEIGRQISSFQYSKPDMENGRIFYQFLDEFENEMMMLSKRFSELYFG